MKKTFVSFFIVGLLGTTSCTETFEPSVDYGDRTYINDYSALVAAVNDLNKSIGERFDALNQLLDKNMADIKLAIDANTGAIQIVEGSMEGGLASINAALFNGFSALSKQLDETGKQLVYAINENGELLRLEIDKTGKLISAQIKESADALVAVIDDQTTTLAIKFNALNSLIKKGFADVTVIIGKVGEQLHLDIKDVNTSLGTINTTLGNGFTYLGGKIEANGVTIAKAINEKGEVLKVAIGENGKVISAEIEDFKDAYVGAEKDKLTWIAEISNAIKSLEATQDENAETLIEKLEAILKDNGIYGVNDKNIYMSPEMFGLIESAGEESAVYQKYLSLITGITEPAINFTQYIPDGGTHDHPGSFVLAIISTETVLAISNIMNNYAAANGKQVVELVKVPKDITYTCSIPTSANCTYPYIYSIKVTDAKGQERVEWENNTAVKTVSNIKLYPYYEGKYCATIDTYAYTRASASN
ncbi:hypothetical protein [Phocaeicola sp.]